jgi:hypothetical protein
LQADKPEHHGTLLPMTAIEFDELSRCDKVNIEIIRLPSVKGTLYFPRD